MDDLCWVGDADVWHKLTKFLQAHYEFTDLGPLTWFLGMQVTRDREQGNIYIVVDQSRFVASLLEKHQFDDDRHSPMSTPAAANVQLSTLMNATTPADRAYMRQVDYRALVGGLLYLVVGTRPDCAQAVGALTRFQQNPGPDHWKAAKRVLRYVAGTPKLGLTFGGHRDTTLDCWVLRCQLGWRC